MRRLSSRGFTIIELLIATVVFSVVLLILTGAIIQFTRIYYKGVIVSRAQETARNVVSDISGAVQFSGKSSVTPVTLPSPPSAGWFCVGAKRYTFRYGIQVTSTQHALVADNCSGALPSMTTAYPAGSTATELLGDGMQLVNIGVSQVGSSNLYTVTLHIAYGANGDLVLPAKQECQAIIRGGQFCAVAKLNTTVAKRID
jgi:prepilin-type N-terminal cleavage/methylation domain-containing protein